LLIAEQKGASTVVTDAGRGKVFVDEGLELEVRRHLMPLAAFLVHRAHRFGPGIIVSRTHESCAVDALQQSAGLLLGEDRGLAAAHSRCFVRASDAPG
jgi:hypothetical protein